MIILHIDEQRGWRGGEQQASYLIRGLVGRGHQVILAGRRGAPFLTHGHGVPVLATIEAPFCGEWDVWTAWKIARAARRYRVDILHAHTSHAHTAACLARALAGRGRVVVSRRVDFTPKQNAFTRWKYRQPDRIVAISDCIADVLRGFGVDAKRLRTVHSAIDPARLEAAPLNRASLGIPDGAPLLLNVAALVGHKDQRTLIDAMARVVKQCPEARLLIAGEGPLRAELEQRIAALGLVGHVRLLGYRQDVPGLLRTADLFVLSSKQEGLGTAVLDAMACGLPVVATAGGGIPEMVVHEETGLLVPSGQPEALAQALLRMLGDGALRMRTIEGARRRLDERFTADRMIEGNLKVYEEALNE